MQSSVVLASKASSSRVTDLPLSVERDFPIPLFILDEEGAVDSSLLTALKPHIEVTHVHDAAALVLALIKKAGKAAECGAGALKTDAVAERVFMHILVCCSDPTYLYDLQECMVEWRRSVDYPLHLMLLDRCPKSSSDEVASGASRAGFDTIIQGAVLEPLPCSLTSSFLESVACDDDTGTASSFIASQIIDRLILKRSLSSSSGAFATDLTCVVSTGFLATPSGSMPFTTGLRTPGVTPVVSPLLLPLQSPLLSSMGGRSFSLCDISADSSARSVRPMRLLMMEDTPINQVTNLVALRRLGLDVIIPASAEDAIKALTCRNFNEIKYETKPPRIAKEALHEACCFDAALLDFDLGEWHSSLNGPKVADLVRQQERELKLPLTPLLTFTSSYLAGDELEPGHRSIEIDGEVVPLFLAIMPKPIVAQFAKDLLRAIVAPL